MVPIADVNPLRNQEKQFRCIGVCLDQLRDQLLPLYRAWPAPSDTRRRLRAATQVFHKLRPIVIDSAAFNRQSNSVEMAPVKVPQISNAVSGLPDAPLTR